VAKRSTDSGSEKGACGTIDAMSHYVDRVEKLRAAASAGLARVSNLESRTTGPALERLKQARYWFGDVKDLYLRDAEKEGCSQAHQQRLLHLSEVMLDTANKVVSEFDRFGHDAKIDSV
jgi:hypothetical protein